METVATTNVRRFWVIDEDGKLKGVVSLSDLLRFVVGWLIQG